MPYIFFPADIGSLSSTCCRHVSPLPMDRPHAACAIDICERDPPEAPAPRTRYHLTQ